MEWFIAGNVPSLKNSKVATAHGVFHSKTVSKYLQVKGVKSYSPSKKIVEDYKTRPNEFRKEVAGMKAELEKFKKPYRIGLYAIRDSKRKFDYINFSQIILDLLTAHGVIDDDNMDEVIPVFLGYEVDKSKAGVKIKIMQGVN